MDGSRSGVVAVFTGGSSFRLEARAAAGGGLHPRLMPSCPTEAGGRKIHQILAQGLWPNTFRLDRRTLGKPIGLVTRQNSWEAYLGHPMEQTVPGTCAIVSCNEAVEAANRFQHEKVHGEGTFKCRASPPDDLLEACRVDGIWMPGVGGYVGWVLLEIQVMEGLPAVTTTITTPSSPAPCVLPLRSWQKHTAGLSPERVAALLDSHGPSVGVLWVCPWYHHLDASSDDTLVYRGCGRSEDDRKQSEKLYPGKVGSHAVVCFAYRFCGGNQMHVLVRDNHDAAANGPQRWIDVEEIDTLYTINVEEVNWVR